MYFYAIHSGKFDIFKWSGIVCVHVVHLIKNVPLRHKFDRICYVLFDRKKTGGNMYKIHRGKHVIFWQYFIRNVLTSVWVMVRYEWDSIVSLPQSVSLAETDGKKLKTKLMLRNIVVYQFVYTISVSTQWIRKTHRPVIGWFNRFLHHILPSSERFLNDPTI